jgi:HSP20 family molecular chaperone IbpA
MKVSDSKQTESQAIKHQPNIPDRGLKKASKIPEDKQVGKDDKADKNAVNAIRMDQIQARIDRSISSIDEMTDDPFYRLEGLTLKLDENKDAFVLRAEVPQYLQKHVKFNADTNQVTVRYARRHEEQAGDDSHKIENHRYTTYSERMKLPEPVKDKEVSVKYHDDHIEFIMPKYR